MKATNFKFDENTTKLLEDLKTKTGSNTKAEVVRKALALLSVTTEANLTGDKILVQSHDGTVRELIIL